MSLTAVELGKKIKAGEVTVAEAVEGSLWRRSRSMEENVHSLCDRG